MQHRDKEHAYEVRVHWTGNQGPGTASYRGYGRDHEVAADGRPTLLGSADRAFRGDPDRWNPEDLLVAALSECHMLSYLALAAAEGLVVTGYDDTATGSMTTHADSGGEFTEVVLHPVVQIADPADRERARALHSRAHEVCFIARSVSFPVHCRPETTVAG